MTLFCCDYENTNTIFFLYQLGVSLLHVTLWTNHSKFVVWLFSFCLFFFFFNETLIAKFIHLSYKKRRRSWFVENIEQKFKNGIYFIFWFTGTANSI